ncbi:pilus assembly protein PilM [Chloroflexota bacterium]
MARKITTLYISDTSIRLMVIRGKRINKLADAPLDMSMDNTSAKVREAEIVAKIKQLLKTHKIKTKKVILGLSGLHCLSRPIVLPLLPKAMLDEAVLREANRVLPVPSEQLYISWQIISVVEGKMQAFMVAIPRDIADSLIGTLRQAGLKPYAMTIKPLALAGLIMESTAIVVDVQSGEIDIVIMVDGVPQPVRTLPLPEEELSLPDKLFMIKDELKRTIQFYNSNMPDNPIQPNVNIYVSGELAEDPELYESIASELGYTMLPLSSPLKCPKQLDPAHYLVNVGLALKDLRKEAGPLLPNINTLPVPYQPKQISLSKLMVVPTAGIAVGLIVLLGMTIQDAAASIDSVHSHLDATNFMLEQKQSQKNQIVESIAAMEKELADTESALGRFTAAFENMDMRGERIDGDLESTVNNMVNGIKPMDIVHTGGDLNITGQAPSEVEILQYARNLDTSGRFSEVTVASIMRTENSDGETGGEGEEQDLMGFTLTLKLKEK